MPLANNSVLGEFQSMALTSSALCAFCAAMNFSKMARASASFAAACAGLTGQNVAAKNSTAVIAASWDRRANGRGPAPAKGFVGWIMLTSRRLLAAILNVGCHTIDRLVDVSGS